MVIASVRAESYAGGSSRRRCPAQSVEESGARLPEAVALRPRRVDTGALDLRRALGRLGDAWCRAQDLGHRGDDLVHARRDTGPDVVQTLPVAGERREDRIDNIADVHVVALCGAVAENGELLAASPSPEEDRDDPALQVLPLTWAVDVREAQGDVRDL